MFLSCTDAEARSGSLVTMTTAGQDGLPPNLMAAWYALVVGMSGEDRRGCWE
jgi:hypothetical protein